MIFLLFLCWLQSEYCVNHFRKEVLIFFFYVLKCSNKLKTHRHLSLLVNLTTSGPPQPAQRRRKAPDVLLLFLVWIICVAKNMWNKKSPGSITLTLFKTSFKAVSPLQKSRRSSSAGLIPAAAAGPGAWEEIRIRLSQDQLPVLCWTQGDVKVMKLVETLGGKNPDYLCDINRGVWWILSRV